MFIVLLLALAAALWFSGMTTAALLVLAVPAGIIAFVGLIVAPVAAYKALKDDLPRRF